MLQGRPTAWRRLTARAPAPPPAPVCAHVPPLARHNSRGPGGKKAGFSSADGLRCLRQERRSHGKALGALPTGEPECGSEGIRSKDGPGRRRPPTCMAGVGLALGARRGRRGSRKRLSSMYTPPAQEIMGACVGGRARGLQEGRSVSIPLLPRRTGKTARMMPRQEGRTQRQSSAPPPPGVAAQQAESAQRRAQ